MVEWGEKLGNVKCKNACWVVSHPSHLNEMGKSDSSIWSGLEFEITKLALIDKIISYYMELESFTNDFFNEFTQSIEKNYGSKHFWRVIQYLVRFQYHYCSWNFEVRGPEAKVKTWIHNFDYVVQIHFVFEDMFEMTPRKFIRSRSRGVIALSDSNNEFFLRESIPLSCRKSWYFIKYSFIDETVISCVKWTIQCMP